MANVNYYIHRLLRKNEIMSFTVIFLAVIILIYFLRFTIKIVCFFDTILPLKSLYKEDKLIPTMFNDLAKKKCRIKKH